MQLLREGTIRFVIADRATTDIDEQLFIQRLREANPPYYIYVLLIVSKSSEADLTAKAQIEALGRRGLIVVADITDPAGLGTDTYDLVSCQNVMLHVTDDERFVQALANIAALVAPGGALVLTEPILLHAE